MKYFKQIIFILLILLFTMYSFSSFSKQWGNLKPGKFSVGFKLIEIYDYSRSYPSVGSKGLYPRPIRIYIWYPAKRSAQDPMLFKEYIQMAAEDFYVAKNQKEKNLPPVLPVQLKKGIDEEKLKILLKKNVLSVRDIPAEKERFPLIVLGQGLYYESPFSQFVLSEFLASHGYVVATCPLLGTHYRLANINIRDLETQVRDLEFVLGYARRLPYVDSKQLGIIGYDMGGMAGLILVMRNPIVDVFLSLDSGINFTHFSGIPSSHPSYQEQRFIIPWFHMTQSRFIKLFRDEQKKPSLYQRKVYSDSYLVHIPTTNHGCFTSYAVTGIENPVSGYWGTVEKNLRTLHHEICNNTLLFFNGYLKQDQNALQKLNFKVKNKSVSDVSVKIELKQGKTPPPLKAELINSIINLGIKKVLPEIGKLRKIYPAKDLFDESALNWLGYHFLYWWGREAESIAVFKLNTQLFPDSSNAVDSLGEAYLNSGNREKAIKSYKKALELNPDNNNAKQTLKRLEKNN